MRQMCPEGERQAFPGEARPIGYRADATSPAVPQARDVAEAPAESRDRAWAVLVSAMLLALGWCIALERFESFSFSALLVLLGGWPFGLLIIGFFVVLLCIRHRRVTKQVAIWLAITFALAAVPVVSAISWVRVANAFALALSCMLTFWLIVSGVDAVASPLDPFRALAAFVREQFVHIGEALGFLGSSRGMARGHVLPVVGGILLALLFLAVTMPLLMQADAAFGSLVEVFWDVFSPESVTTWVRRIVHWLVIATLATSLLWAGVFVKAREAAVPPAASAVTPEGAGAAKEGSPTVAITALGVIDAVYLVFVVVELGYLFGGAAAEEVAEYARTGFFQLVAVTAINLVTLSAVVALCGRRARSRTLVACELVLVGVTAVMLASAAWRMGLYVGEYGLSLLRICVIWAILAIGCCLVLAVARVLREDFPAFRIGIALVLAFWAAFALARPVAVVADYNVDAYLSGRLDEVDVDYLSGIGPDAIPALRRLEDEDGSSPAALHAHSVVRDYEGTDSANCWPTASLPEDLGLL